MSDSRVALVTGCGKPDGIGWATAARLSALGLVVAVTDAAPTGVRGSAERAVPGESLAELANALDKSGPGATHLVGDISSDDESAQLVHEVVRLYGRLDVLVNNASAPHGDVFVSIDEVETSEWDRILAVNLRGTFLMCRQAVKPMIEQRWGRVINISSIAGRTGLPRRAAYSASKSGILGLTRSMAVDVAPFGVTVNALCPGPILTSRTTSSLSGEGRDGEEELKRRVARVPVGRMGTPDDIAGAVAFFASDDASFITGQALNIDGGMVMA